MTFVFKKIKAKPRKKTGDPEEILDRLNRYCSPILQFLQNSSYRSGRIRRERLPIKKSGKLL